MKNIFRKNQVIITSLAIMIAVAGYINFTSDKLPDSTPVNQSEVLDTDEFADIDEYSVSLEQGLISENLGANLQNSKNNEINENEEYISELIEDIGEGYYEANADENNTQTESADDEATKKESKKDNKDNKNETTEDNNVAENEDEYVPGEAVLTGGTNIVNFAASAKLNREQSRARNKESLMDIINNNNIGEAQKQEAIDNLINLNAFSEKENITETLLAAKGYSGSVVSIIEGSVDVVINKDELTKADIAKIEDIVKRKTGISIENIVITHMSSN